MIQLLTVQEPLPTNSFLHFRFPQRLLWRRFFLILEHSFSPLGTWTIAFRMWVQIPLFRTRSEYSLTGKAPTPREDVLLRPPSL